jgi:nucleoid-associated protein YgaU
MKKLIAYSLPLIAFILSGCVTRVIPYDVDRVDQELKGNRGVIQGKAQDLPKIEKKKTKRMYDIEVELSSRDMERGRIEKVSVEGNRGYIQTKEVSEKKSEAIREKKGILTLKPYSATATPQVIYQQSPTTQGKKYAKEKGTGSIAAEVGEPGPTTYVVQKGDTLQKISNKVYGTTKKWKKIFEANKDILKDPDEIKPGQTLIIPAE